MCKHSMHTISHTHSHFNLIVIGNKLSCGLIRKARPRRAPLDPLHHQELAQELASIGPILHSSLRLFKTLTVNVHLSTSE